MKELHLSEYPLRSVLQDGKAFDMHRRNVFGIAKQVLESHLSEKLRRIRAWGRWKRSVYKLPIALREDQAILNRNEKPQNLGNVDA